MKKIKICSIQTNIYSLFTDDKSKAHGGSEVQLYLLANELCKSEEYQFSFIVGDFKQPENMIKNNIRLYKAFNPHSKDSLMTKMVQAFHYYALLKRIDPDICLTSSANSTVGLVALFCKLNSKKHIHRTAHIMDVDRSYIRKNGILGRLYLFGLKNAHLIFTQTRQHFDLLMKNHQLKAVILSNSFSIPPQKKRTKKSILWVARYEIWKQPQLFLDLARKNEQLSFIMICNPNAQLAAEWTALKNQAGQIKNLEFIDRVPFTEIKSYFDQAKVFVNTSREEGFPNTFIQAGISRTPVLSLTVDPDHFITQYNCGYYCAGQFSQLNANLRLLVANEKEYQQKADNIYQYVLTRHNITQNIKTVRQEINCLLDQKK